tara:strand:+ start:10018 stop:10203 length:186 start_codon:yes stop_codon:yes gene_type:complete
MKHQHRLNIGTTQQQPGDSINPAIADFRLQGTANSPSSTAIIYASYSWYNLLVVMMRFFNK